jgi:hypothetical protein
VSGSDRGWFDEQTAGAPPALRQRAGEFLDRAPRGDRTRRLAAAGNAALAEAVRDGADRTAALSLLAADALITLALLSAATSDPGGLGHAATALRVQATGAQ